MFELATLFGSSLISSTLLPGGSEAYLIWLAAQHQHSLVLLVAVASLGNVIGSLITFFLGVLLAKRYPLKVLANKRQEKVKRWLERYGVTALLFAWLPVVGDPLCFVAGWLRLSLLWSAVFITIGKVLRYAVIAQVGVQL